MRRILALCAVAGLLAAEGYAFPVDTVRWYRADWSQDVTFSSLADELTYRHELSWRFALRTQAVSDGVATVRATITRITAAATGPGVERRFDSSAEGAQADPLFGHLGALAGATLDLEVVQADGTVRAIGGIDALRQRLEAAAPSARPGQPSPLADEIARTYGEDALRAWWGGLLALPGSTAGLPLGSVPAAVQRTWTDTRFELALPGGSAPEVVLADDPTPVRARLVALSGGGEVIPSEGMPGSVTGEATATFDLVALTQSVRQVHRLKWSLALLAQDDK